MDLIFQKIVSIGDRLLWLESRCGSWSKGLKDE